MKSVIFIAFFYFVIPDFAQEGLKLDSTFKTSQDSFLVSTFDDSITSNIEKTKVKKNTQQNRKKIVKSHKPKFEKVDNNNYSEDVTKVGIFSKGQVILGIVIISILLGFIISRLMFRENSESKKTILENESVLSDYLARMSLSRRDYYRNVYLKSEEWKRKRYLVLKRDNWRCVYCGAKATQVHHTKYASRNIGKEPIEWLVSICETCHDAEH